MSRILSHTLPLLRLAPRPSTAAPFLLSLCPIHTGKPSAAEVSPLLGTGPPPEAPVPSAEKVSEMSRVKRRKRQAEMLREARSIRNAKGEVMVVKRRFWSDVSVKEVDGALEIFLDTRPLRHPSTKAIVRIPPTKHALATALAIEWDQLSSATDATKSHLLPLTSLTCRAIDIAADDTLATPTIRPGLVRLLMRYLDTDSVLCWAPEPPVNMRGEGQSLRDSQRDMAMPLIGWLTANVWKGVTIEPALDDGSIFPKTQAPETRGVIEKWATELNAWDLAGLERAVISGKSFLVAARLLSEWSEDVGVVAGHKREFSADAAAKAANIEIDWQTSRWGEVEDTHDVEKQDIRRHYGSVVLLVSGIKEGIDKW